jgi:hypothetical protein
MLEDDDPGLLEATVNPTHFQAQDFPSGVHDDADIASDRPVSVGLGAG